jgi:hypothetical protein
MAEEDKDNVDVKEEADEEENGAEVEEAEAVTDLSSR